MLIINKYAKKQQQQKVIIPKRFGVQVLESDAIVVKRLVEMRIQILVDGFTSEFSGLKNIYYILDYNWLIN